MIKDDIKKILGICNNDFDAIIDTYVASAKSDLKMVGVVLRDEDDPLIDVAIQSYVCALIDEDKRELYMGAYQLQKDALRHYVEYQSQPTTSQ